MSASKASILGMIYASMFGAMTAIGAWIIIPLPLIPITLQTLFLSLAAALLGSYLGALSQIIYISLGIIGLPVFAGGKAGFGVLMGPTGGYLVGFILGAYIIGKLIEKKERPGFVWIAASMFIGLIVIYILGVAQLMMVAQLSLKKALLVGVLPPLPGDIIKIWAAALITLKLRDRIKL
jgi:biotin transport system substrate-specific component